MQSATALKPAAVGQEHWTKNGDSDLFLFQKAPADGKAPAGTVLFVHGSSMASQPTFDLQVPGRPYSSAMDYFVDQGFETWTLDLRGYGRSDKRPGTRATIAEGAEDLSAATDYILKTRDCGPFHVYGISSGALRAAAFTEMHPERVKRLALDAFVWTGEGSHTLDNRRKKLPDFREGERRPIDKAFVYSDLQPRPSRHRGRQGDRRLRRRHHRARRFHAERHLYRHVHPAAADRPGEDHRADHCHARRI